MKMNTLLHYCVLFSFAAFIPFLSSCGSSAPKTRTILLPYDIPLELVELPIGLMFGKYEVTQAQWRAVMGENPSRTYHLDNPVENVTWNECQQFIEKLNWMSATQKLGIYFRLPTAWEWDLACLAGAVDEDSLCRLADGTEITWETRDRAAPMVSEMDGIFANPVGQKEPNAFGLYDMLGNVEEWLQDRDEDGERLYGVFPCDHTFSQAANKADCERGFRLCATTEAIENHLGSSKR